MVTMTRRHFITTGIRFALLALLLPFLPREVKAESEFATINVQHVLVERPDGSILFDGTEFLRPEPPDDSCKTVYLILKDGKIYAAKGDGAVIYQSENTFDGVDSWLVVDT